jgi:hypothetical protein
MPDMSAMMGGAGGMGLGEDEGDDDDEDDMPALEGEDAKAKPAAK